MTMVTDEYMQQMMARTKEYCIVILKAGPNLNSERARTIIWEHARRNFALRNEGVLSIVCPVADASEVTGIGIFNTGTDQVRAIMNDDPGVREGLFVYEVHPCRSFPGDCLPG